MVRCLAVLSLLVGCSLETGGLPGSAPGDPDTGPGLDAAAGFDAAGRDARLPRRDAATMDDAGMLPPDWWDPTFRRRVRLVFDNSASAADLDSFPVLIVLSPGRVDYGAIAPGGADLRFVDDDHVTVLSHEIERFRADGKSYVWVKVPRIDMGSTTDHIWLYYGNPGAADGQDRADVWSNRYHAVYHLNGNDLSDATGTHGPASELGGSFEIDGVVGGARRFDGVDDYLDTNCTHQIDDLTVIAWGRGVRAPQSSFISGPLMREQNYQLTWDHTSSEFRAAASLKAPDWEGADFGSLDADTWYLLGLTYQGIVLRAFVDGTQSDTNTNVAGPPETNPHPARIARHAWRPDGETPYFEGDVDEVRIATVARGSSWMRAQHLSMVDAFVTFE